MNDREGTVIAVSRAQFQRGAQHARSKKEVGQRGAASIFYLHAEPIERDAKITPISTEYAIAPETDTVIEEMIQSDIISAISGELEKQGMLIDAHEIWADIKELRESGFGDQDILEYVLEYTKLYFPELHDKAEQAIAIIEAREMLVDLQAYSHEHSSGTL